MPTNLFASDESMDLDRLHQFLSETVQNKQQMNELRRQPPMDFEERTVLIESRSSMYCDLIKPIQVFNSMISMDPTNAKQYQENLMKQLELIYTKINSIDTQFSQDDANREHYKLPFTKPQTQPTDEEINKESISTIMKAFNTEAENIKQIHSTMKENRQTEYSTDDDRSSTGSYKAKSSKGRKITYCSV